MTIRTLCTAAVLGSLLPWGVTLAQPAEPVGTSTRAILELQASGAAASPEPRPMPGDIADKVYKRYADSFGRAIPDKLDRDNFSQDGGE